MKMEQARKEADGLEVDVLNHIQTLIAQVCMVDRDTVSGNSRLLAFGIDSIRVFELMMDIEEDFEIQMEPEKLAGVTTVKQLAEYVEALRIEANRDKEG
jgi:acyl carrier protein